jgi:hypothetical protein
MNLASDQKSIAIDFSYGEWLNTNEAASYLRLLREDGTPCVERIRNLVNQRRIPFYKPFGRLLFKKSELKSLIESSRKGGFKWR